jgi:uncharacterized protein YjbJ (UPF0337 family)
MTGAKAGKLKGLAKEAAGSLAGNKKLESQGKAERRTGEAKEKLGRVEDKAEEFVDKAKDALAPK